MFFLSIRKFSIWYYTRFPFTDRKHAFCQSDGQFLLFCSLIHRYKSTFDDFHRSLDNKVNLNSFYNTQLGALSQQTSFLNKVGQEGRCFRSHVRRREKHEIIASIWKSIQVILPILTNERVIIKCTSESSIGIINRGAKHLTEKDSLLRGKGFCFKWFIRRS